MDKQFKRIAKDLISWLEPTQETLANELERRLRSTTNEIVHKVGKYIYLKGDSNVLLVAHMDTVRRGDLSYKFGLMNGELAIANDKSNALGGDCRVGCYLIYKIYHQKMLEGKSVPSLLFTYDEEIGAKGADDFAKDVKAGVIDLSHIVMAIEPDKSGHLVYTRYDDTDEALANFMKENDWKEVYGSFSDICSLQAIGITSVNVGSDYYHQHTANEYVNIEKVPTTRTRISELIAKVEEFTKETSPFKVKERKTSYPYGGYSNYSGYYGTSYYSQPKKTYGGHRCFNCGTKENVHKYGSTTYCEDCIEEILKIFTIENDPPYTSVGIDTKDNEKKLAYCTDCGLPFVQSSPDVLVCDSCLSLYEYGESYYSRSYY